MADLRALPDEELTAIEQRAEAATPGPWESAIGRVFGSMPSVEAFVRRPGDDVAIAADVCAPDTGERSDANADFLAHARTDVPALCAEVRRLRDALEKVRAEERERAAGIASKTAAEIDPFSRETDWVRELVEGIATEIRARGGV